MFHPFTNILRHLTDPRVERTKRYPLINLIFIGICSVICGNETFTGMEVFGKARRKWLEQYLGPLGRHSLP